MDQDDLIQGYLLKQLSSIYFHSIVFNNEAFETMSDSTTFNDRVNNHCL